MVEQKAADTILQKPIEVKVGSKTYEVAKPTLATLMEVSRYISLLPDAGTIDENNIVPFILSNASQTGAILAKIAAVLIVGAQNIQKIAQRRKKGFLIWFSRKDTEVKTNVDVLSEEIAKNVTCEELNKIISEALSHQRIGFFLSSIISLKGANVSEKTKS